MIFLSYPNGYYELDLAVELDKFCFLRLCELSETIKEKRSEMSKLGIGLKFYFYFFKIHTN